MFAFFWGFGPKTCWKPIAVISKLMCIKLFSLEKYSVDARFLGSDFSALLNDISLSGELSFPYSYARKK